MTQILHFEGSAVFFEADTWSGVYNTALNWLWWAGRAAEWLLGCPGVQRCCGLYCELWLVAADQASGPGNGEGIYEKCDFRTSAGPSGALKPGIPALKAPLVPGDPRCSASAVQPAVPSCLARWTESGQLHCKHPSPPAPGAGPLRCWGPWHGALGISNLAALALLLLSWEDVCCPRTAASAKTHTGWKEAGLTWAPTHRHPAPHAVPRGDTLVALDTFVAPVTLDGGVPFHPRVLHHLWEGSGGYQGRQQNKALGPGLQKVLAGAQVREGCSGWHPT